MPNPNAIVSSAIHFEPELEKTPADMLRAEGGLSVILEGKHRIRLDPEDPRSAGFAQILDGLSKLNRPVYVEIDPESSAISVLLIPHVTRVIAISPLDDDALSVELEHSHGRHILRRDTPDFAGLERHLREAMDKKRSIILTENDAHEIIDVRTFHPGPEVPSLPFPEPESVPRPPWPWRWIRKLPCFWRWWPWRWFCCLSTTRAQQVFDAMNSTSCDPLTVPAPCIPFLYPDDGCWGRAHEMCRLMINMGLVPKKVWIKGGLHVSTKNNPDCSVWWGWHVAPTLCVRGTGFLKTQDMVIDPSLFTTPVSRATWKGVQGDPNATLTDTDASIFHLWSNATDPAYVQTNQVLAIYRLQLQNRAVQHGPPPYAHCP